MPVEIDLGMPPAGYCSQSARAGEQALVQTREFTSTEDGQHFIQRLEGLPSIILERLPRRVHASQVDQLLAIIRRDGKATVYVNELQVEASICPSRAIEKGAAVTKDDIVDIDRLDVGIQIPRDAGVLFLFSHGWRKGLFYDFGPLDRAELRPRRYDLAAAFGQAYCQVLFQERFSIIDDEWESLFAAKWFPFAGLRNSTIDKLIAHIRAGWNPDDNLDDIVAEVKAKLDEKIENWRKHPSFELHIDILERAAERFQSEDFVSATGLLFPRIEGILRTNHTGLTLAIKPSQSNLVNSAVAKRLENEKCLLLPRKFAAYLSEVYFANFNPVAQSIDVSRNSVAHGVATSSEFNRKSALLGLLVVEQLFYCWANT